MTKLWQRWKSRQVILAMRQFTQTHHVLREPYNLISAAKVGILCQSPDAIDQQTLLNYVSRLEKQGKQVHLLAFIPDTKTPEEFPFPALNWKDCSWKGIPESDISHRFITQELDVLLTLCDQPHPVLQYLSALSKAHLRIGPQVGHHMAYDLIIDVPTPLALPHFINQIEKYLTVINPQRHESLTL